MNAPKHLTLRNVPSEVMRALDRERRRKGTSLNRAAIEALSRGLGVPRAEGADNGLGALAGSWDTARLKAFEKATAPFEAIDDELWK